MLAEHKLVFLLRFLFLLGATLQGCFSRALTALPGRAGGDAHQPAPAAPSFLSASPASASQAEGGGPSGASESAREPDRVETPSRSGGRRREPSCSSEGGGLEAGRLLGRILSAFLVPACRPTSVEARPWRC